ncbi:MAG: SRPBCC family protein [Candidatus Dormibacteraeota bacterium]|nr:SRPBCC family protein [Candidatus Dormibacteraeota bacterium]
MNTRANQQGGGGLLGTITQQLASAAQQYVEARGEQILRDAGQRLTGVIDNLGDGSMQGQATKEAAKSFVQGGSPAKAIMSGATGAVKSMFGGNGGSGGDGGGGKGAGSRKSTNIIEDIDVGVPLSVAYNQWTQFQEFASFMKGVEGVDVRDEIESNWRLKIGLSRRSWEGQITEEVPDRRIAWTSQGAKGSTKGVVSFHPLADDLTKVIVVMEYTAVGPFEKVGNMMRLQLRRVRLDLREFKKFISMQNEETGSWRGEIRDGEVVRQPDEEEQQPEGAEGQEQPAGQAEEQSEAEEQPEAEEQSEAEAEESEEGAMAEAGEGANAQGSEESGEAEEAEAQETGAGGARQAASTSSGRQRGQAAQRQRPPARRR